MVEKTKAGCTLRRDFMMSPSDENINFFYKLLEQGFKEVYYTAPYHWGVLNPKLRKFVTYTEGDVNRIVCPNKKTMMAELESEVDWFKKAHSRDYCAEGIKLLKKMRGWKN